MKGRVDSEKKTLVIGLGHRARHGKDTVAAMIKNERGDKYDIVITPFAKALKEEVLEAFRSPEHGYWKFLDEVRHKTISSFMKRVKVSQEGCWEWQGKTEGEKGYGIVYTADKPNYKAHRFMWEQVLGNGPVQLIRHTCDNRICVNPLHLEPGTLQQNSQDMVDRLRMEYGENHHNAKLSDQELNHILDLYWYWDMTQAEIAEAFKCSSATVSRIITGKTRVARTANKMQPFIKFSEEWLNDSQKPKVRRLLQHYGTEYRRNFDPDYWVKRTAAYIHERKPDVAIIPDMRFPNEMDYVERNGVAVKVVRPGMKSPNSHPSEEALEHVPDYAWFDVIMNNGTLEELKAKTLSMFDSLMT